MDEWDHETIGNCVTKSTHKNFDHFTKIAIHFEKVTQLDPYTYVKAEPKCNIGEILYAVMSDGTRKKIQMIIDSGG